MKKYSFIIAALFAFAAVACQKETADPRDDKAAKEKQNETVETDNPSSCEVTVFTAKLPEGSLVTRTVIGEADGEGKYTPLWTEEDAIIVNGVKSTSTELVSDGASARFTVAGVEAPYLVLAPGSMFTRDGFSFDSETNTYNYLVSGAGRPQKYTLNGAHPTYDPDNGTVIAAYSNDAKELTFHHLCVYYKITVNAAGSDDSDNIRSIYIRQGDGSNIAGKWKATLNGESDITIAPPSSPSNVIKLDCGENGVAHGTPMIVAVPAYNFDSGLIITLKDVNGHFCSYKMKSAATQFAASAGTIFDFEPIFSPGSGTINNAEDWEAFAAAVNSNDDKDLYRWVGNGTVKIGADFTAGNLTKIVGAGGKFIYNVDGQNHTITRTAGTGALFRNVRGTVSNLNLAGEIASNGNTCGAFADSLYAEGRISDCINYSNVSVNTGDVQTGSRAGGFVGIMTGGIIERCINNGSVLSSVNCTGKDIYNLQVGGIVGQVDGTHATSGDAVLYDCTNNGNITADPVSGSNHSYLVYYAGIGGIAGWLRGNEHSFILNNCDNNGTVFYSAEHVTHPTGTKANSISVGGIVGIAGDQNSSNGYDASIGTKGLDVTIRYCDNYGTVHNCGINYATTTTSNKRVYTGGITGSLVGTAAKYAKLARCRNTGTILTYDVTGVDASTRPVYCQVAGGLIGYGGYVSIDSCKVNCTIGNGKRQSLALGGAIGHTMAPFKADRDTVWFKGYFVRVNKSNHINSSSFATVVKKWGDNDQSPSPSITGSTITNSRLGALLYYYNTTPGDLNDNSENCTSSTNLVAYATHAARGYGYNDSSVIGADVTFSGNVTINAEP